MAWTTPKTWVDQETVSADDFNTQIRDNLDSVSGHTHTGVAGDGSATLDSLDYIDLDQQGALSAPATGHTRFAANTDGTLRYYANGGSEKTVADTTHTHTIASSSEYKDTSFGQLNVYDTTYTASNTELTRTFTPSNSTSTQKYVLVHFATAVFQNGAGSGSGNYYMRVLKDSVQQVEVSEAQASSYLGRKTLALSTVYITPSATSTVFELQTKRDFSTASATSTLGRSQILRQVRCQ